MTYIKTGINQPGILELLFYKGTTGKALSNLTQTIMRGPSPLTPGEREIIAAYVSNLNECEFCMNAHGAVASQHLNDGGEAVSCILNHQQDQPFSEKMKTLLKIVAKVQKSGKAVREEDIEAARKAGATDEAIHDTVLIAASFCMFNRYVDGLGTNLPADQAEYKDMAKRLATKGYTYPPLFLRKFVIRMMDKMRNQKKSA